MPAPKENPVDTEPALDLRAITPGTAVLSPLPRAIYCATDGSLEVECPDPIAAFPVMAGQFVMLRPRRILAGTTATVVALY
jgi:hypothetical protein